jgi:coenzyme F420-reducing hydrogenase alpha subunit
MARTDPALVKNALRMKKAGNAIIRVVEGREIHPVNVRIGGFFRAPPRSELEPLVPELRWARDAAREALERLAGFTFPSLERDYEFVSLRHESDYPIERGRVVSSRGLDIAVSEWDRHFVEEQVPHSTALHARLRERGHYLAGPLARFNLNFDRLSPLAREAAERIGLVPPVRNPFRMILVRMVEAIYAYDEALRIIESYAPPTPAAVDAPPRAGTGYGATEAPRGLLYHRYSLDHDGTILDARIVPPTSQNQATIEADIATFAPRILDLPMDAATHALEQLIRSYDPCISCATHFLDLTVHREPAA